MATFLDHLPEKNAIDVAQVSQVFFRIEDTDGIDVSQLNVSIGGNPAIINGVYQGQYSGIITNEDVTPTAISVLISHDIKFDYNDLVAIAIDVRNLLSVLFTDNYNFLISNNPIIEIPIVSASPKGNIYTTPQTITLTSNNLATTVYYTEDGTTPDLDSNTYTAPILVNTEGTTQLKFFAIDASNIYSNIITEAYTIDSVAPITTATPAGGAYFKEQQVVLAVDDLQATIYYTTDGSVPDTNSQIYSSPITIPINQITRLRFFAIDEAGNIETEKEEQYEIALAKNNIIARNVMVTSPFNMHILDIRWDDMYEMNTNVRGYNVYRADVEIGPYAKLNNTPITITQYQDRNLDLEIIEEDVSEQFRRTVNIFTEVNDEFLTPHIDISKWSENDHGQFLYQSNGLIFFDGTGLSEESRITSKYKLNGDFEIELRYLLYIWNKPVLGVQSSIFRIKTTDQNYVQVSRDRSATQNIYSSNIIKNGNPDLPTNVIATGETASDGILRISRSGDLVKVYYVDDSETFIELQSYTFNEDDVYVEIIGKSSDVPIDIRHGYYHVNAGNPLIIGPLSPQKQMFVQTSRYPIVDSSNTAKPTSLESEVSVTINGQNAIIKKVHGLEGCIELDVEKQFDEVLRTFYDPPVPNEYSTVLVTYKVKDHKADISLRKKYYYKVTVLTEEDETDLDVLKPKYLEPEALTYIYAEAIRRNSWLLDNAGERVLLYLKKRVGVVCPCRIRDVKRRTHRRADYNCVKCYGVGFVGGFDGPFPIRVAPLTSEQRIMQTERGMKLAYQIETWTGPSPLVQQRDLVLRRNGDRALLGPITPVEGPGGVIVQQHFVLEVLDYTDIRYKLSTEPLPDKTVQPGIDKDGTKTPEIHSPKEREELVTNKGVDRVVKGRSISFENKLY